MAASTQTKNVKIGPCKVSYKGSDLGYTKGGVEVSIVTNKHDVNVDQFGSTLVNSIVTGRAITIKVPMAETDFNKLVNVIPGAVVTSNVGPPAKKKMTISHNAGLSLADLAGALVLHPTANVTGDVSDDVTAPLASPGGDITFSFVVDNERVYTIEFTVFPDETTGVMLVMGDTTTV